MDIYFTRFEMSNLILGHNNGRDQYDVKGSTSTEVIAQFQVTRQRQLWTSYRR